MDLNNLFNQSKFDQYAAFLKSTNLSDASLKRKFSSLSSFQKFLVKKKLIDDVRVDPRVYPSLQDNLNPPAFQAPSLENSLVKGRSSALQNRGIWFKKIISRFIPDTKYLIPNTKPNNFLFRYIAIFSLFAIGVGLGFTLYQQAFIQSNKNLAYSTATNKVTAGRFLSFQGRLTDSPGNPISSETDIKFNLWNKDIGGTLLYTTVGGGNSQTVTPDDNGIFSVTIGKSHGSEIPATVFSENAEVWLEITVGTDDPMDPRQPIATVAYAMNAETLQGLPPSASGLKDTVLVIDSQGNLNLGETSPTIKSISGTMGIEGQAILIKATDGSGGNIEINPDGAGVIKLTTEGYDAGIVAKNANLMTGNLISGEIGNATRSYNFLDFQNFDVGTSNLSDRFYVNAYGDTYVGGTLSVDGSATFDKNLSVGGTLNLSVGASAGYILTTDASGNASWKAPNASGIGTSYTAGNGITLASNNQFKLGGSLTENTSIGTSSSFLRFTAGNGSTEALYISNTGKVGIGTTNPTAKLDVTGDIKASTNITAGGSVFTGAISNGSGESLLLTDGSGLIFKTNNNEIMRIGESGNVGIGTTNPLSKLSVVGSISGDNLVLSGNVQLNSFAGFNNYLNSSGGLGTGGIQRITSDGNLTNINSIQAGQLNITSGGTFGAGTVYSTNDIPFSITSADFNGDGKVDLATSNNESDNITVFINNGNGTYGTGITYPTIADYPASITSADFNGDGKVDLATANNNSNSNITVFTNTGNGTYGTGITYPTIGTAPVSITSADFNGDGKTDLATANGSNNITVFINTGNGIYGTGVTYPTIGTSPYSITSADFNGDGKFDLATANYTSDNITVFTNTGNGTYGTGATYPTIGTWPQAITSADFNGDGKFDLATVNFTTNDITVFTNTGNGTYGTGVIYPTIGTAPQSITSGDFNGDGKFDLATANYDPSSITVFTNQATPTLFTSTSGNVGLGTTDPLYKLSVVGNASISTNLNVGGTLNLSVGASAGYILTTDASGNASWIAPTSAGIGTSYTAGEGLSLASNTFSLDLGHTNVWTGTQNFNAGMILGTTSNTSPGTLRFNGTNFEAYNGTQWSILDSGTITKDPTGFPNRTDTSLSFLSAGTSGTFTITGTNFKIYIKSKEYTKNTEPLTISPLTAGTLYYIYYDTDGTLKYSTSAWDISTTVQVATVYWTGTTGLIGDERHGLSMDGMTHEYLHQTVGARYSSGLTGTFSSPPAFSITAGSVYDEDLKNEVVGTQTTARVIYQSGSTIVATDPQSEYYYQVGGVIQYNNAGNTAPVTNGRYVAYWIFATNDATTPIYSLMGQFNDTSIANARTNNTYESLNLGNLPFKEMKLLYRVILRRNLTTETFQEAQDYRSVSNLPAGTYVATSHSILTGLTNDDHLQYSLLAGRLGGQVLNGGTSETDTLTLAGSSNSAGGNIYLNPGSGNVGIGTTGPTQKLDVNGSINLTGTIFATGTSGSNGQVLTSTGTGLSWVNAVVDTNTTYTANNGLSLSGTTFGLGGTLTGNTSIGTSSFGLSFLGLGNSQSLYIASSGNVGIGTTSPTAKLQIGNWSNLNTAFNMALGFNVDTNLISGMDFNNVNSSGQVRLMARNDQNDYLVMNAPGSGVETPFFGQAGKNTNLIFSQSPSDTDKKLTVGTYNAGDLLLGTSNTERMRILSTGNVGIGTSDPKYKLEVTGDALISTRLGIGSTNSLYMLNVGGTAGFNNIFASGFVGIGITNPTTSLDIVTTSITSTAEKIAKFGISDSINSYISIENASASDNAFMPAIRGVNGLDNRTALRLIGDVADATYTGGQYYPAITLQAKNISTGSTLVTIPIMSINNSNDVLFQIWPGAKTKIGGTDIQTYTGGALHAPITMLDVIGNGSDDLLNLIDGTTSRLYVKESGNVGIGTTAPTKKLDVDGDIKLNGTIFVGAGTSGSNGQILTSTGVGLSWITLTDANTTYTAGNGITLSGTQFSLNVGYSNAWTALQTFQGGIGVSGTTNLTNALNVGGTAYFASYVGIGTATPSQKLHVKSTSADDNTANIYLEQTSTNIGSRVSLKAGTIGGPYFAIETRDIGASFLQVERLRIDGSGNVGIGTTNPLYKLEVSGDALISTRLGIGATNSSYALNVSTNANIGTNLTVGSTLTLSNINVGTGSTTALFIDSTGVVTKRALGAGAFMDGVGTTYAAGVGLTLSNTNVFSLDLASTNTWTGTQTFNNASIGGTLNISVGASAGYLLTSDNAGNASWAKNTSLSEVFHDLTLTGLGTSLSPLSAVEQTLVLNRFSSLPTTARQGTIAYVKSQFNPTTEVIENVGDTIVTNHQYANLTVNPIASVGNTMTAFISVGDTTFIIFSGKIADFDTASVPNDAKGTGIIKNDIVSQIYVNQASDLYIDDIGDSAVSFPSAGWYNLIPLTVGGSTTYTVGSSIPYSSVQTFSNATVTNLSGIRSETDLLSNNGWDGLVPITTFIDDFTYPAFYINPATPNPVDQFNLINESLDIQVIQPGTTTTYISGGTYDVFYLNPEPSKPDTSIGSTISIDGSTVYFNVDEASIEIGASHPDIEWIKIENGMFNQEYYFYVWEDYTTTAQNVSGLDIPPNLALQKGWNYLQNGVVSKISAFNVINNIDPTTGFTITGTNVGLLGNYMNNVSYFDQDPINYTGVSGTLISNNEKVYIFNVFPFTPIDSIVQYYSVNTQTGQIVMYVYLWKDITADMFESGIEQDYKIGWNKLEANAGNLAIQTFSQISYSDLPNFNSSNPNTIVFPTNEGNPQINIKYLGYFGNTTEYSTTGQAGLFVYDNGWNYSYVAGTGLKLDSNIFKLDLASANTWTGAQTFNNVSVGGSLSVNGTSYFADNVSIGSTSVLYDLNVGGTAGFNNLFASGNVGIGTTAPSKKLDVIGDASISTNLTVGSTLTLSNINVGTGTTALFIDSTGVVTKRALGTMAFDSGTYDNYNHWNLQTNGTGTTDILTNNTVSFVNGVGISLTQSGSTITINNSSVGTTYTAGNGITLSSNQFKLGGSLTEATTIGISSSSLRFTAGNGSTEALYISNTGKIGIGTTNPLSELSVSGSISGNNLILSGNVQLNSYAGFNNYLNSSGGLGTGGIQRITSDGNLTNINSIQAGQLNITGGGTFGIGITYPTTGDYPTSITSADFNGDGKADLATADNDTITITVFINTGDGTYGTGVTYPTLSSQPTSITSADLNGDGKTDLATANYYDNKITVLINNGDGTFATGNSYSTIQENPQSITAGDFNGDGKTDLATANNNGIDTANNITVFINNGNGKYQTGIVYSISGTPTSITSADLNGDGKAELAISNSSNDNIIVFTSKYGIGNSTLSTGVTYQTIGTGPISITSADLNSDSKTDLATANSDGTITILINKYGIGSSTLSTGVTYPTIGIAPQSITSADFNGDGRADLATANSSSNNITVFTNNNGTFGTGVTYPTIGINPQSITATDLNGDGKADLATTNKDSANITVFTNQATPTLFTSTSGNVGLGTTSPTQKLDIAGSIKLTGQFFVGSAGTTGSAGQVLISNGNGSLDWINSTGVGSVYTAGAGLTLSNTNVFSLNLSTDATLTGLGTSASPLSAVEQTIVVDNIGNLPTTSVDGKIAYIPSGNTATGEYYQNKGTALQQGTSYPSLTLNPIAPNLVGAIGVGLSGTDIYHIVSLTGSSAPEAVDMNVFPTDAQLTFVSMGENGDIIKYIYTNKNIDLYDLDNNFAFSISTGWNEITIVDPDIVITPIAYASIPVFTNMNMTVMYINPPVSDEKLLSNNGWEYVPPAIATNSLYVYHDGQWGSAAKGDTYDAVNGLSLVGNQFKLGGLLNENTSINTSSFGLSFLGIGNTQSLYIASDGNVGIGTTAPKYKFEVAGDALISTRLGIGSTNVLYMLNVGGTANFTNLFASGSVGIGTTAPNANLEIFSATPRLRLSYVNQAGFETSLRSNGGNPFWDLSYYASNTLYKTLISANYDGNVGIGTTAPNYKLEVNGSALITTLGVGATNSSYAFNVSTNANIGTTLRTASLNLTNTAIGGSNIVAFLGTGTSGLMGYLSTTGWDKNASDDNWVLQTNTGTGSSLSTISIGTTVNFIAGTNIGLGKSGTAITISNNISANNGLTLVGANIGLGGILSQNTDIGFSGYSLTFSDAGTSLASFSSASNTFYNPTTFASAGDVAIAYDLNFTNSSASSINSAGPISINAGEIFNSSNLTLQTYNAGKIILSSANLWNDGTNFGIGTSTPTHKLEIIGNASISTSLDVGGTAYFASNVGIGTSTPTAKLHVIGDAKISTNIYADNFYDINDTRYWLNPGNGSSNYASLSLNNAGSIMYNVINSGDTNTFIQNGAASKIQNSYNGLLLSVGTGDSNAIVDWKNNLFLNSLGSVGIGNTYNGNAYQLNVTGKGYFSNLEVGGTIFANSLNIGSSDVITSTQFLAKNGTITAPGYAFASDLHTGLWRPEDNNLAFSVGQTEALRINSSGFVGIGTTNPTAMLTIVGDNDEYTSDFTLLNNDGTVNLEIRTSDVGVSGNTFIGKSVGSSNTSGIYNTALGYEAFSKNGQGSYNTAIGYKSLNLSDNAAAKNNTAIGANSLSSNTLGYNNVAIGFESLKNNTNGYNNIAIGYQAGQNLAIGSSNIFIGNGVGASGDFDHRLYIGNNQNPIIYGDLSIGELNSGHVGIGTTNPTHELDVVGDVYFSGNLSIGGTFSISSLAIGETIVITPNKLFLAGNGTSGTPAYSFIDDPNTGLFRPAADNLAFSIGGTETLRIKNNGFVGIGTTNPQSLLELSSINPVLQIGSSRGSDIGGKIRFTEITNSWLGAYLHYDGSANRFNIGINTGLNNGANWTSEIGQTLLSSDTPSISILRTNGFVGIGTTNPTSRLSILGDTSSSTPDFTLLNSDGTPNLEIRTSLTNLENTFIGKDVGFNNSSGSYNTGLGYESLFSNIDGKKNVAIGPGSLYYNTTGDNNIAIGYNAGSDNTIGSRNIIIGNSIATNSLSDKLYIGNGVPIIYGDLSSGATAGYIGLGTTNPTAKLSVSGTGYFSGSVGIGGTNLNYSLTVKGNTIIGTGQSGSLPLYVTGYLHQNSANWHGGGSSWGSDNGESHPISIYSDGDISGLSIWARSDKRIKENIVPINENLVNTFFSQLNPVNFNWKSNGNFDTGYIAQDLIKLGFDYLVSATPDSTIQETIDTDGFVSPAGTLFSVNYQSMIPILAAGIKNNMADINSLKSNLNLTSTGQINVSSNVSNEVLASLGYSGAKNEIESASYSITDSTGQAVSKIAQFGQIASAKIKAGLITTTNLIADNLVAKNIITNNIVSPKATINELTATKIESTQVFTDNLSASDIQTTNITTDNLTSAEVTANNATISGNLYADNVVTKDGSISDVMANKVSSLRDELTNLISSSQSTPSAITGTSISSLSSGWNMDIASDSAKINGDLALTNNLIVGAKLTVNGDTQLGNAFITGTFTTGQIAIKDNFIETTNTALYIQPSNTGSVHLMGDTLVIADNGEVQVNGDLKVSGSLIANLITANEIQTNKLTTNELTSNQLTSSELTSDKLNIATDSASQTIIAESGFGQLATSSAQLVSNATAGTSILPWGKTELIIKNNKLTKDSMVYLTPVGSTNNQVVYLKEKFISTDPEIPSYFTIALDNYLYNDITVNWWIIN